MFRITQFITYYHYNSNPLPSVPIKSCYNITKRLILPISSIDVLFLSYFPLGSLYFFLYKKYLSGSIHIILRDFCLNIKSCIFVFLSTLLCPRTKRNRYTNQIFFFYYLSSIITFFRNSIGQFNKRRAYVMIVFRTSNVLY